MSWDVRLVTWQQAHAELWALRHRVFVEEQQVPEDLELDGLDPVCVHVGAFDPSGQLVGTGRMQRDGHIGRMAVDARVRRSGVGGALLDALMHQAVVQGLSEVYLDAQLHALEFYQRHGFVAEGDVFLDAGIEHRRMRRRVP